MKIKIPTWTTLVEEALRAQDDFMDYRMLMKATRGTYSQISAACFSLREYRVIGCLVNPDGVAWWYARPKEDDTRHYHRDEQAPGKPKNRKAGKRVFKAVRTPPQK